MPAAITTTVTELPESRVRVDAQVAPAEFQRALERAARELGRGLRVAGFRKGKVPPAVVIQRVGRAAVIERALQDGLTRWWRAALDEADVAPIGQPKLDITTQPSDGEPLAFAVEVGVCPAAALGPYKGLEVGRRRPEIDPDAIDAELLALREGLARAEAVQRPAADGDLLVIDFNGLIDGEPFEGGRGRDQMVELGSGMLVPGFEEQLEGAVAGETRTVDIDFPNVESPKDHRAEDVAGSTASFVVKVKEVLAKQLPALDDGLAEQAGFDTLGELREDIAARLLASDEERVGEEFGETVLDAVAGEATVELPEALVAARARELWEATLRTLDYDGVSKDVYLQISGKTEEQALAELGAPAAQELRREAVVLAIAAAEGIVVDDADLRAAGPSAGAVDGPDGGGGGGPQTRAGRRGEFVRARVLELLSREAVAITLDEARERNKPLPRDHAPPEPDLPEPELPPPPG